MENSQLDSYLWTKEHCPNKKQHILVDCVNLILRWLEKTDWNLPYLFLSMSNQWTEIHTGVPRNRAFSVVHITLSDSMNPCMVAIVPVFVHQWSVLPGCLKAIPISSSFVLSEIKSSTPCYYCSCYLWRKNYSVVWLVLFVFFDGILDISCILTKFFFFSFYRVSVLVMVLYKQYCCNCEINW